MSGLCWRGTEYLKIIYDFFSPLLSQIVVLTCTDAPNRHKTGSAKRAVWTSHGGAYSYSVAPLPNEICRS